MKKLFGVKSDADTFIGKIVDICQGLSNANWYDFGVGMGSILLLVLLKELKQRSGEWKCAQNFILSKIIWFLGTAKAAIVTILMMSIAIGIEGPVTLSSGELSPIQNFLDGNCRPGTIIQNTTNDNSTNGIDAGCTILTLTKIQNVPAPQFGVPALMGYSYPYCTGEAGFEAGDNVPSVNFTEFADVDDVVPEGRDTQINFSSTLLDHLRIP